MFDDPMIKRIALAIIGAWAGGLLGCAMWWAACVFYQ